MDMDLGFTINIYKSQSCAYRLHVNQVFFVGLSVWSFYSTLDNWNVFLVNSFYLNFSSNWNKHDLTYDWQIGTDCLLSPGAASCQSSPRWEACDWMLAAAGWPGGGVCASGVWLMTEGSWQGPSWQSPDSRVTAATQSGHIHPFWVIFFIVHSQYLQHFLFFVFKYLRMKAFGHAHLSIRDSNEKKMPPWLFQWIWSQNGI